MKRKWIAPLALAIAASACAPRVGPLARTVQQGEVLEPQAERVVQETRVAAAAEQAQLAYEHDMAAAAALATCAPDVCAALARGELVIGMNQAQALAATRTTLAAWQLRQSGGVTLLTARSTVDLPEDRIAPVAWIGLRDGFVASYTYREPQGLRAVTQSADATLAGRSAARADALLLQGDEYVAAGQLELALERYDQADVLRPAHAATTLRIAQVLDKQLRPIEAVLRYQLFVHQLELERLRAEGEVAANITEAIARAHERIVVLERR